MADQRSVLAAELFKRALDRPAEERATFLEQACGADLELRCEVESLLKFSDDGDEFLEQPVIEIALKSFLHGALKPDQRIGTYKIVSQIGSGGMGEVYLAHDERLNRRVALKLARFGIGGEETARHFRREAQILASLNHRNIAQLYGAEITYDGFSFLVMEWVVGVRIDKYCDNNHLSIRNRLEMFRRVCGAVHYAHQRLIIHRDIKPANILITKEGEPKLLDFGIAKLLDVETSMAGEQTVTFAAAMTPEYASPEQVRGEPMTTASDIYSLGVLLYELLTGQPPYRIKGQNASEIARAITEHDPARPSTAVRNSRIETRDSADSRFMSYHSRALRGDLDNIVLKAMRKEPQRRYASVEQFSEDIRRHLADLPVIARPDTRSYRTTKFVQRHTLGVVMTAAIFLALASGIIATLWQAHVAREQREVAQAERERAQLEFNDVRKLATSFLFEFNNSIQNLPGATPARKLLVQRALEYLSKLAQQSQGNTDLQWELAEAYLKVGDLQGNPYEPNLGDTHGAEESYEKALAISTALVQADSKDSQARRYLARSYQSSKSGDLDGSFAKYRQAAGILEKLSAAAPADLFLRGQLSQTLVTMGAVLAEQGKIADARSVTSRGLAIARDLASRAAATPDELSQYALVLLTCSPVDLRDERTALQKAKQAVEKSGERDPKGLDILAQAYFQTGDSVRAIDAEKKALSLLPAPQPKHNGLPLRQRLETQLTRFESGEHGP